jgi:hypothetical protein
VNDIPAGVSDYDRGVAKGEVHARLAAHDHLFDAINGSIAQLVVGMNTVSVRIEKLSDGIIARDEKAAATAAALRDAEQARHEQAEAKWSIWQKMFAILSAFAAIGTVIAVVLTILLH